MGKKALRKRMHSLLARIQEHEQKILREQAKANPDDGSIQHWQKEIAAFRKSLECAEKRLKL